MGMDVRSVLVEPLNPGLIDWLDVLFWKYVTEQHTYMAETAFFTFWLICCTSFFCGLILDFSQQNFVSDKFILNFDYHARAHSFAVHLMYMLYNKSNV
jgi:hypothetical protein